MKNSDMKVVAIILAIALFFTIITSNAVSVASVVLLAADTVMGGDDAGTDAPIQQGTVVTPGQTTGGTVTGGTTTGGTTTGGTTTGGTTTGGTTTDAPAANGGTSTDAPAAGDKAANVKLYTDAAKKLKSEGSGFDRKTWQAIQSVDLGALSDTLLPIIQKFVKTEDQVDYKTKEAKDFPASTFTEADVASATAEKKGDNTVVTIIMNDEVTPVKDTPTGVAAAAGYEILYMTDVKDTIAKDYSFISLTNESMEYKGFKIVAEITPDGKFVSVEMSCPGHLAATVGVAIVTLDAKGVLEFYSSYKNFTY